MGAKKQEPQKARSPKRTRKGSTWRVTVTAAQGSVAVTVFERRSRFRAEYRHPTKDLRIRISLGTDDFEVAIARAKALADDLALKHADSLAAHWAGELPGFTEEDGEFNASRTDGGRATRITETITRMNPVAREAGQHQLERVERRHRDGEADVIRPVVMTESRYQVMLRYARDAEMRTSDRHPEMPPGFLTLLLTLARGTGQGIASLLGLRIRDLLLDQDRLRSMRHDLGVSDDRWPFGAIYWNPQFNKRALIHVVPISERLHHALICYLETRGTTEPDAWLIPCPWSSDHHPSVAVACKWFRRIEECAGEDLATPTSRAWFSFSRLWCAERVGFFPEELVAVVGGWGRRARWEKFRELICPDYVFAAAYLIAECDPVKDGPIE